MLPFFKNAWSAGILPASHASLFKSGSLERRHPACLTAPLDYTFWCFQTPARYKAIA
jgi:hypothetical protein